MTSNSLLSAAAALALVTGLSAPAFAQDAAPAQSEAAAPDAAAPASDAAAVQVTPAGDLVETLKASGKFTTFIQGLDATNLTGLLKTNKNLTVFAPSDAAFATLPAAELEKLKTDKTAMQKFLLHHVINAPVDSSKIQGARGPVPSGAGDQILLDGSDEAGALKADGATIVQADVRTGSGLLHVVDKPLTAGAGDAQAQAPAQAPAQTSGTN